MAPIEIVRPIHERIEPLGRGFEKRAHEHAPLQGREKPPNPRVEPLPWTERETQRVEAVGKRLGRAQSQSPAFNDTARHINQRPSSFVHAAGLPGAFGFTPTSLAFSYLRGMQAMNMQRDHEKVSAQELLFTARVGRENRAGKLSSFTIALFSKFFTLASSYEMRQKLAEILNEDGAFACFNHGIKQAQTILKRINEVLEAEDKIRETTALFRMENVVRLKKETEAAMELEAA
ncbi:MAG: hypothetical protein WCV91_00620 [Candidatus Margulisiibacteriota bacterium]|jgi:hypothetical protein